MVEQSRGLQKSKNWSRCQPRKPSTSLRPWTHAAKEAIWLRRLIGEVFKPIDGPTVLFSDSQSAIALAKDGHYHARTKHIDIRYHFIRYIIEEGTIKLIYCPTDNMTVDTLTKALPSVKAKHFASALGLSTV